MSPNCLRVAAEHLKSGGQIQYATTQININDAANGVPIGHPRPHNITHTGEFHINVESRLQTVVNTMTNDGYGAKAIRSALQKELRLIGKEIQ